MYLRFETFCWIHLPPLALWRHSLWVKYNSLMSPPKPGYPRNPALGWTWSRAERVLISQEILSASRHFISVLYLVTFVNRVHLDSSCVVNVFFYMYLASLVMPKWLCFVPFNPWKNSIKKMLEKKEIELVGLWGEAEGPKKVWVGFKA